MDIYEGIKYIKIDSVEIFNENDYKISNEDNIIDLCDDNEYKYIKKQMERK